MNATKSKPVTDGDWKVVPMKVDRLLLDPDNPRLASADAVTDKKALVKFMWEEMAVNEVALSIAANGFFQEEPLLVIPAAGQPKQPGEGQKYTVVEGNRRLCAVMLLRDARLREFVKATDLPTLSQQQIDALNELPVSIYDTRKELWAYF